MTLFFSVVKYRMANHENQPDQSTSLARAYLDGVPKAWYFSGIQSESVASTRAKLAPLADFVDAPRHIVSVGVGAGEEVRAAIDIFSPMGARVHGLDLSHRAISQVRDQLREDGLDAGMVIGDAAKMPFPRESVDGIIESAIHHEIYSYSKDGKDAWRRGITEAARTLSENGALLLRDFAAPSFKGNVAMTLTSDIAKGFYKYFREQFRVFESWDQKEAIEIVDKREPNDLDYPPLDEETNTVTLPFANAAEVMLHFRIFKDKKGKGLLDFGDPTWKEINEIYLPPHPDKPGIQAMPQEEYVQTVLQEANDSLADTDYEMVCVQNETSSRPKTVQLFAEHFSLSTKDDRTNEELLAEVPNKMELVFKKVKKKIK